MTSNETSMHAPTLIEDREISEIAFPVRVKAIHERGEGAVVALARAWGIPIRLLHVSNSIDSTDPDLEAFATRLRKRHPDVEIHTKHLYGDDPARAVADAVGAHSLVAMTSDHADEWRVKGSVAESVLHSAGVPVLIFGPHVSDPALEGEIIVGIDGSTSAELALTAAKGLADSLGSRLWLVRVVPQPRAGEPAAHHPELVRALEVSAAETGGPGDVGWEIIQSNDPVDALESFATSRGAAFIVAGAKGRADVTRTTMGSITMGLVATSTRPILTVQPSA